MHHHCNEKGCAVDHQHSHHGSCPECGCGQGQTCDCCCHQEGKCFSDQLLAMADEAWMELLKEKIKKKIEESTGKHLDKLAGLVAKANHARWNHKMEITKLKEEYKQQLSDFFNK